MAGQAGRFVNRRVRVAGVACAVKGEVVWQSVHAIVALAWRSCACAFGRPLMQRSRGRAARLHGLLAQLRALRVGEVAVVEGVPRRLHRRCLVAANGRRPQLAGVDALPSAAAGCCACGGSGEAEPVAAVV
jgi:hypothetical protein